MVNQLKESPSIRRSMYMIKQSDGYSIQESRVLEFDENQPVYTGFYFRTCNNTFP